MDISTEAAYITATAIGAIMPPIIAVIQKRRWSDETRYLVALICYLIVSLAIAFIENDTDTTGFKLKNWLELFLPMALAGISSFKLVWNDLAAKIEEKTT